MGKERVSNYLESNDSQDSIVKRDEMMRKLEDVNVRGFVAKGLKEYLSGEGSQDREEFKELCADILTGTTIDAGFTNALDTVTYDENKGRYDYSGLNGEQLGVVMIASLHLWLQGVDEKKAGYFDTVKDFLDGNNIVTTDGSNINIAQITQKDADISDVVLGENPQTNNSGVVEKTDTGIEKVGGISVNYSQLTSLGITYGKESANDIGVTEVTDPETYVKIYKFISGTNSDFTAPDIDLAAKESTDIETPLTVGDKQYTLSYEVTGDDGNKTVVLDAAPLEQNEAEDEIPTSLAYDEIVGFSQGLFEVEDQGVDLTAGTYSVEEETQISTSKDNPTLFDVGDGADKSVKIALIHDASFTDGGKLKAGGQVEVDGIKYATVNIAGVRALHTHLQELTPDITVEQVANLTLAQELGHLTPEVGTHEAKSEILSLNTDETNTFLKYRLITSLNSDVAFKENSNGTDDQVAELYRKAYNEVVEPDVTDQGNYTDQVTGLSEEQVTQIKENYIALANHTTAVSLGVDALPGGGTIASNGVDVSQTIGGADLVTPDLEQTNDVIDTPQASLNAQESMNYQFDKINEQFSMMGKVFESPVFQNHIRRATDSFTSQVQDLIANTKGDTSDEERGSIQTDITNCFTSNGFDASCLLDGESGLTKSGDVLHNLLQGMFTIAENTFTTLTTNLSNDQNKIVAAGSAQEERYEMMINGMEHANSYINKVNSYIGSDEGFVTVLQYLETNPGEVGKLFVDQADQISGQPQSILRINQSAGNFYETSTDMLDTYGIEQTLSNGTLEDVAPSLKNFFASTTKAKINGETVYFNSKQLEAHGISTNQEGKPITTETQQPADQLLLDARQNEGTISGFSVSTLVHTLYNNEKFTVLDGEDESDRRDADDATQEGFVKGLTSSSTYEFSKKQNRQLIHEGDLSKKINGSVTDVATQIAAIKAQKPLQINGGLLEEPNDAQNKLAYLKIDNGGDIVYLSQADFQKRKKPHEQQSRKELSKSENNSAQEAENLGMDYRTLALQKYGIQSLEENRNILSSKDSGKQLTFVNKENKNASFVLDMTNTRQPDIQFDGKRIGTKQETVTQCIQNTAKFTDISTDYTTWRTENQKERTDTQTNQITFLNKFAQQLITGSISATSVSTEEYGFTEEIDFKEGGVTIDQFPYNKDTHLLSYTPPEKEEVASE